MEVARSAIIIFAAAFFTCCHGFTVDSCSTRPADDVIEVKSVNIQPYPVQIPGSISISALVNVTKPINGNLTADVIIKRRFGSEWYQIPCLKQIGSCRYQDVCGLFRDATANKCPLVLTGNKIPCSCPVPAGIYTVSEISKSIDEKFLGFKLPPLAGHYQVTFRLTDSVSRKQIACLTAGLELVDPPSTNFFSSIGRFFSSIFGG